MGLERVQIFKSGIRRKRMTENNRKPLIFGNRPCFYRINLLQNLVENKPTQWEIDQPSDFFPKTRRGLMFHWVCYRGCIKLLLSKAEWLSKFEFEIDIKKSGNWRKKMSLSYSWLSSYLVNTLSEIFELKGNPVEGQQL